MKVLLIRPPHLDLETMEPPRVGIPLGTLSIAASVENKGHEVKVFDSLLYPNDSNDSAHFGASFGMIGREVVEFGPDIIGIANLFSTQMKKALALTEYIKSIYPQAKIVVGGPHATSKPEEFLLSFSIDIIVIAEGEITLCDVIDYYRGKKELSEIKGVAYMKGGRMYVHTAEYIQNLDSLPYPAYHLVDMEKYFSLAKQGLGSRYTDVFHEPKREITMITSRGCPYECIFCSIHPTMGYKFRYQSPEYVAGHIELLVRKYRADFIHFEDDNLTLNQPRFSNILDVLWEKGIKFEWDTPNGVRADALNFDLLKKIKRSGVRELRIAIESANDDVLNSIVKKKLDLEKAVETMRNCYRLKIPLSAFYIIGFPGETKENIQQTLDFAYEMMMKYNVTPHLHIAIPLVGTEMYNIAKGKGYLTSEDYTKGFIQGMGRIKTEHFNPEDLKEFSVRFHKKIRKLYLIRKVRDPGRIIKDVKTFVKHPRSTIRIAKIAAAYTR
ncbi:MAG: radical SAM protein [Candidatus Aenigmarchaeota archaeon]|nr:radical SAM protein [Candidatus Aenigmarchaeota archaeon]MDI6722597.1 radical SAM protein [Candidatus Aenigmarchaeota archaeon]